MKIHFHEQIHYVKGSHFYTKDGGEFQVARLDLTSMRWGPPERYVRLKKLRVGVYLCKRVKDGLQGILRYDQHCIANMRADWEERDSTGLSNGA